MTRKMMRGKRQKNQEFVFYCEIMKAYFDRKLKQRWITSLQKGKIKIFIGTDTKI